MHITGAGVEEAEQRVSEAVENPMYEIEALQGRPFLPKNYVLSALTSELWKWLSSKKCSFDHPAVNLLLEFNEKTSALCVHGGLYQISPFLKHFPSTFNENLKEAIMIREEVCAVELQAHQEIYTPKVIRDSFLSTYNNEVSKGKGRGILSIKHIKYLMMDVIFASVDTSASFLTWFILLMVLNMHVQQKIQAEIYSVIERDQLPSWQDVEKLPHLQATVCEVMRYSWFEQIFSHHSFRDTTIGGYSIPKNTTVLWNLHHIHQDLKE